MTDITILQKKISQYYANYFKADDLIDLIGLDTFKHREFGFQTFNINEKTKRNYFKRNISYKSVDDLITSMSSLIPRKLYFGAVYDKPLEGSIKGANWVESHLRFDIDITDSEYIRNKICDCKGTNICSKCFEIGKEAVEFLKDTLENDFCDPSDPILKYLGRKYARDYISGSRGFHVHYPQVKHLHSLEDEQTDKNTRRNLISYLQMVAEKPDLHLLHTKITSINLKKRVERIIAPKFFSSYPIDELIKMEWFYNKGNLIKSNKKKMELLTNLAFSTEPFNIKTALKFNVNYQKAMEKIMLYRYPRYDGSPTFDTRKVIKVPMSVDGSTGNIVHEIKHLDSFTIKDIIHIDHYF